MSIYGTLGNICMTSLVERDVETRLDKSWNSLGWDDSLDNPNRTVYKQKAKTDEQNRALEGKKPDFVLYREGTDDPLIVIEAKRPSHGIHNIHDAMKQGIGYAKRINAPIVFATADGITIKTLHLPSQKPLYLNKSEVDELIRHAEAVEYARQNTYELFTEDPDVLLSKDELIKVFAELNDRFKDAGVRAGLDRIELFCNMLFLKVISEMAERKDGLHKTLPEYCHWNRIREKRGQELLDFINGQAFDYFKSAYDGDVLSPLKVFKPQILNTVVDKLDGLTLTSTRDTDIKGDAFEYFLRNYGGADTDFGEYFTPRHVVKTLTKIIDPKFGEKVYDPFCGTGGMLIYAFKHIHQRMVLNDGIVLNDSTLKSLKQETVFGGEFTEMFRVAKMNMILAGDGHSNVVRQDSYESKPIRKGKYDVVMTNIPFGRKLKTEWGELYGYNTHSVEITGVLHCLDSLNDSPNARAGIIVPEGILFDNSKAYTQLRQELVEKYDLQEVISLHNKTFGKNTGAKSNILIVKKRKNPDREGIWYFNVENDGFTRDAHRRSISGTNDLDIVESEGTPALTPSEQERLEKVGFTVLWKKKLRARNYNLVASFYKEQVFSSKCPMVRLGDIAEMRKGTSITKKKANTKGAIPVIAGGRSSPYSHDAFNFDGETITVSASGAYAGFIRYHNYPIWASDCSVIKTNLSKVMPRYLYWALKNQQDYIYTFQKGTGQPHIYSSDLQEILIPLPALGEQERIIAELDGYQKVIDGARTMLKDYRPAFSIKDSWKKVKLGDVVNLSRGKTPKYGNSDIQVIKSGMAKGYRDFDFSVPSYLEEGFSNPKLLVKQDILINTTGVGTAGRITFFDLNGNFVTDSHISTIRTFLDTLNQEFLYYALVCQYSFKDLELMAQGTSGQTELSQKTILDLEIFLPAIEEQERIVAELEAERAVIESSRKMIKMMKKKIQERIESLWH